MSAAVPGFKDHFSHHAGAYAAHRPLYPAALFEHLSSLVLRHDMAWDCATCCILAGCWRCAVL